MSFKKSGDQEPLVALTTRLAMREELERSLTLASRKSPGVEGRIVPIMINFFPLKSIPTGDIVQYDVIIEPDLPKIFQKIFNAMVAQYGKSEFEGAELCYDGRSIMYASKPLAKNQYQLDVTFEDDGRKRREPKPFKVTIKRVSSVNIEVLKSFLQGQLNYTPYIAISALEVIFKAAISKVATSLINVNRSFYSSKNPSPLTGPMEAWAGLFQSLRPSPGRLLLNIDTSSTCFYKSGLLLDLALDVIRASRQRFPNDLTNAERSRIEKAVRGLYVKTSYGNMRKYRVIGLCDTNCETTIFTGQDGHSMNVLEYFMQMYKLRIQHPHFPCVNAGTKQRPVALPIEFLTILEGQRYPKKLNEIQTAEMIRLTAMRPHDKLRKIEDGPTTLGLLNNNILKSFGVQVDPHPLTVDARVLKAPPVVYNSKSREHETQPADGAWNLKDKVLFQGAQIRDWAVVNMSRCRREDLERFIHELCVTGSEMGVTFGNRKPHITNIGPELGAVQRHLEAAYQSGKEISFVMVILERKETASYAEVKRVTDAVIGRPSQCIVSKNLAKVNRQFCANVILKLNAKLGGINSIVPAGLIRPISAMPTIVFGADVTHPGPGEHSVRSVAAVCASMDPNATKFASSIYVQESKQEVIVDLKNIVITQLRNFYNVTKHKPARIIFYRDGVSEGQFGHIMNTEVNAIKKACQELQADYNPKITFLIVQKRHHIRFFPKDRRDSDRSGNCLAGTVVDNGITSPLYRDFYLLSHSGIQGTSRPVHYHVLIDENDFDNDTIENLTNRLCYTYARCTRSVSIAPPAYYAHLIAARGRFHFGPDDTMSMTTGSSDSLQGVFLPMPANFARTMFFC